MINDMNVKDVIFNRDTISNWTDNQEKQLKELQGDVYDNYRNELIIKQMQIYDFLIVFEENSKYGIKSKGFNQIVIPAIYDSIKPCWSNFFIAEEDGKYGVVSTGYFDYSIVYPVVCDAINPSYIDLLIIQVDGKYGLLKMEGQSIRELVKPMFDEIIRVEEKEVYFLKSNGKLGLYHHDIIINPDFEEIDVPEVFGWIKVKKDNNWGYIGINKEFTTNINEAFLYYPFTLISESFK